MFTKNKKHEDIEMSMKQQEIVDTMLDIMPTMQYSGIYREDGTIMKCNKCRYHIKKDNWCGYFNTIASDAQKNCNSQYTNRKMQL